MFSVFFVDESWVFLTVPFDGDRMGVSGGGGVVFCLVSLRLGLSPSV
jgi:hypothetical protein